jgi:hypothetical protein
MSVLYDILMFALPGGFVGSVVTWLVNRRNSNQDFLIKLQHSIDLLTEKYTQVLDENTQLKAERADLQVAQKNLADKVEKLTREVKKLTERIKLYEEAK